MSIYDYTVLDINGNSISMEEYKGFVILIVNTASKCGFTPQYKGLEMLYRKYKDRKFTVLGFPCNQFAGQEPGTEEEIKSGCMLDYEITFPMMSKIDVNGSKTDPLFKFLRSETGGFLGDSIKWNFTKFLIDRDGNVVERFPSTKSPESLQSAIEVLL